MLAWYLACWLVTALQGRYLVPEILQSFGLFAFQGEVELTQAASPYLTCAMLAWYLACWLVTALKGRYLVSEILQSFGLFAFQGGDRLTQATGSLLEGADPCCSSSRLYPESGPGLHVTCRCSSSCWVLVSICPSSGLLIVPQQRSAVHEWSAGVAGSSVFNETLGNSHSMPAESTISAWKWTCGCVAGS